MVFLMVFTRTLTSCCSKSIAVGSSDSDKRAKASISKSAAEKMSVVSSFFSEEFFSEQLLFVAGGKLPSTCSVIVRGPPGITVTRTFLMSVLQKRNKDLGIFSRVEKLPEFSWE